MSVIPAIWKAEVGGLRSKADPAINVRIYLKKKKQKA
jgi:hypothetical protein